MASELRRAAHALVDTRVETFEPLHALEASRERVERSLRELGPPRALRMSGTWKAIDGREVYQATFEPAPGTRRFLSGISAGLVLLVASSAWVLTSAQEAPTLKFLLPMFTLLAVVAVPFVIAGIASQREAEEARIGRAIRAALRDENEKFPPPQCRADED